MEDWGKAYNAGFYDESRGRAIIGRGRRKKINVG